jgi:hypothetical protein
MHQWYIGRQLLHLSAHYYIQIGEMLMHWMETSSPSEQFQERFLLRYSYFCIEMATIFRNPQYPFLLLLALWNLHEQCISLSFLCNRAYCRLCHPQIPSDNSEIPVTREMQMCSYGEELMNFLELGRPCESLEKHYGVWFFLWPAHLSW